MNDGQKLFLNDKNIERQKLEEEFEKNAISILNNQKLLKIESFSGYFEFLSNNYFSPVYNEGILYPSVSHAFQASRSSDELTKKAILNAENLFVVGKIAKRIEDPEDWHLKRLKIMEKLLRDKFRRSKELIEKLKATFPKELVMSYEEETSGNLFWGNVNSKGQNQIGRILMKIRNDIIENNELINWITNCFDLITDDCYLPTINLIVNKNNQTIDHILLKNKSFYTFGILPENDIKLDHPSISRYHSVIICDKKYGIILVDLRSKSGTRLDEDLLQDHIPYKIRNGKKINFAFSKRDYYIEIDTNKIEKIYNKEKNKILNQTNLINELNKNKNKIELTKCEIKKTFGLDNSYNNNIFVNHIPNDISNLQIKNFFEEKFGKIKNFECPIDKISGRKKGFAFIQFENCKSANNAVKCAFINLNENENVCLKIKFAHPEPNWENLYKHNKNFEGHQSRNKEKKRSRSRSYTKSKHKEKNDKKYNKRRRESRNRNREDDSEKMKKNFNDRKESERRNQKYMENDSSKSSFSSNSSDSSESLSSN